MFGLFSAKESNRNAGSPGHNGQALIDLAGLEKAYRTPAGDFYALKGIDLRIQPGEFVSVAGKSGAGKSTLINMVTGHRQAHRRSGTCWSPRRERDE